MPATRIVVLGASAGGVEALTQIASELPRGFPAAVFVVLHVPPQGSSVLPQILSRRGVLPAEHPRDRDPIQPSRIYVAPPDCHLLVKRGYVRVVRGPRENGHRPAVDPLFRSAARAYGPNVAGVILSGTLDDGTWGLYQIKEVGGVAIVQDPEDAIYPGMPRSAMENVQVDHVLPLSEIAAQLVRLASAEPIDVVEDSMSTTDEELDLVEQETDALEDGHQPPGELSGLTCPECGGTLWERQEGEIMRFRCHVGHAYSAETLLAEQTEDLENALWSAYRALEESAELARRMAERAQARGHHRSQTIFREQADEAQQRAHVIRRVLTDKKASVNAEPLAREPLTHEPLSVHDPLSADANNGKPHLDA